MNKKIALYISLIRRSTVSFIALWTLGFGVWTSSAAQNPNPVNDRTDYRNFEVIAKKNIFNPRRSPAYVPAPRQEVRTRTETLALVGVMDYGKGPMAFFDGSRTEYKKVLKPNESIAGFKVTAIEPSSVKLASSSTNEMELHLGMQLSREQEGEWKLAMRPENLDTSYARATPMRTASQVNSDRASESDQNNNPFGAIGNFFANGGFRGNGFPGGGFNPTAAQPTPTQPTVTPTQTSSAPSAPEAADSILARLARQRQQETGESPQQDTAPASPPDRGQSPPNQQTEPVRGPGADSPANQPVGTPPNQ